MGSPHVRVDGETLGDLEGVGRRSKIARISGLRPRQQGDRCWQRRIQWLLEYRPIPDQENLGGFLFLRYRQRACRGYPSHECAAHEHMAYPRTVGDLP